MSEHELRAFNNLVKKVQQHEETITQLVEIIAATNRRITDVANKQQTNHNNYKLS